MQILFHMCRVYQNLRVWDNHNLCLYYKCPLHCMFSFDMYIFSCSRIHHYYINFISQNIFHLTTFIQHTGNHNWLKKNPNSYRFFFENTKYIEKKKKIVEFCMIHPQIGRDWLRWLASKSQTAQSIFILLRPFIRGEKKKKI